MLLPVDGYSVGEYPIVARLLKRIGMYRATMYAGRDLPCGFDSGSHVVTVIKVC